MRRAIVKAVLDLLGTLLTYRPARWAYALIESMLHHTVMLNTPRAFTQLMHKHHSDLRTRVPMHDECLCQARTA